MDMGAVSAVFASTNPVTLCLCASATTIARASLVAQSFTPRIMILLSLLAPGRVR